MMFTKKTKLCAVIMAAVMLISLFTAFAMPASAEVMSKAAADLLPRASAFKTNPSAKEFRIIDTKDLNAVANNPDAFGKDIMLYLTADIKVTGGAANHIGCHAGLNGLGHKISGVNSTGAASGNTGWFAKDYQGSYFGNVTLEGWTGTLGGTRSGLVFGNIASKDLTIENVKVINCEANGSSVTQLGLFAGAIAPVENDSKIKITNFIMEDCTLNLNGAAGDGAALVIGTFRSEASDSRTHQVTLDGVYLNNNKLLGSSKDLLYHEGIGILFGRLQHATASPSLIVRNTAVTNTQISSLLTRVSSIGGAMAGGGVPITLDNVITYNNAGAVGLVFGRSGDTLTSYKNVFSDEEWLISGTGSTELSGTKNNDKNNFASRITPEALYALNAANAEVETYRAWAVEPSGSNLLIYGDVEGYAPIQKVTLKTQNKDPQAETETYYRYTDRYGKLMDIGELENAASWSCGGLANTTFDSEQTLIGYVGYFGLSAAGSAYEVNNGDDVTLSIGLQNCEVGPESIDYVGYYDPAVLSTELSKITVSYPFDDVRVYITDDAATGLKKIGIAAARKEAAAINSSEVPFASIVFTVSNKAPRGTITYVRSLIDNATKTVAGGEIPVVDMIAGVDYLDAPKDVNIMVSYNHQWSKWTHVAGTEGIDSKMSRTCLEDGCGVVETVACVFDHYEEVPAECLVDAYNRHTCTTCGYYYDEVSFGTLLGHDFENSNKLGHIEGTEGEDSRHGVQCSRCDVVDLETGEACTFESAYHKATCLEGGFTRYTCKFCGYYYDIENPDAPAIGHDWGKWTANGDHKTHTRTCENDATHTQTKACNYKLQSSSLKPTCVSPGRNDYKCANCGDETSEIIDAMYDEHQQIVIRYCEPDFSKKGADGFIDEYCAACDTRIELTKVLDAGQPFPDMKSDTVWYYPYAVFCKSFDLMQGNDKGNFVQDGTVTRAQVAVILSAMLKGQYEETTGKVVKDIPAMTNTEFNKFLNAIAPYSVTDNPVSLKDIKGKWYERYAKIAARMGIVAGNEKGQFLGDNNVTREQLAIMLKAFITVDGKLTGDPSTPQFGPKATYKDMKKVSSWAKPYVEWAAKVGLFAGDNNGNFNPQNTTLRREMAVLAQNIYVEIRGIWIVDHDGTKLN